MATNRYIRQGVRSEQNLYEDLTIESLKIYGQDVYYLPRTILNEDKVFGDDIPSRFSNAYKIEMYVENVNGFDGEGDLFTKFGVEIRDQVTFVLARRRWDQTVAKIDNQINGIRPREGDIIFMPLSRSMFEIMKVEHQDPFYQLNNLVTYKLQCEKFEYNDEDLDTSIEAIDSIERKNAYQYELTLDSAGGGFTIGQLAVQTLADGTIMQGEIAAWSDSDNVLKLIHVGANDGKYHEFATGVAIHHDSADGPFASVVSIRETNQIQIESQNDDFSALIVDFLDFTESNPFGDPENN